MTRVATQLFTVLCAANGFKNHSAHPGEWKEFVCRLLSPNMILQDTCRLLLIFALHMGYLRDFDSWDQLMSVEAGPHGSRIELKDASLNEAVITGRLRRSELTLNPGRGEQAPDVMSYHYVCALVTRVVYLSGFRDNLRLTSLRRGDAYLLDQHVKFRQTARTLMGQRTRPARSRLTCR